jgi:uncharacterized membrane protein
MTDYPPRGATDADLGLPARRRLAVAVLVGAAVGAASALAVTWLAAVLIGWDVVAAGWAAAAWLRVARLDAADTSRHATRDDPGRAATDALLLAASAASLIAIGIVTAKAANAHGSAKAELVVVSIVSVFVSWALVHTLFTLRYAALYYGGRDGGIDFNQDAKPAYTDFAYLAFTIGMTFQVSDTNLTDSGIRRAALQHALVSYVFGAVILAATINLVAGLVH